MRVSRLTDSGLNMVVGRITAPDDWQVSEQVQWSSFGNYPGMTQLSAVSPDGQRSFQLISTMSYYQTDSIFSSLGENETDPTTYRIHRQYRTAEQFVELMHLGPGLHGRAEAELEQHRFAEPQRAADPPRSSTPIRRAIRWCSPWRTWA